MHYFSNKFSTIAKRWGLSAPQRLLTFNIADLKFRDGSFWSWLWRIKLQNIIMTSFQWRHHHNVTEKRHKKFSNLDLSQSKFLAAPVVLG